MVFSCAGIIKMMPGQNYYNILHKITSKRLRTTSYFIDIFLQIDIHFRRWKWTQTMISGLNKIREHATTGRSKVEPRSKVRTLSGQILPHFDIKNFSVAQKLTKLDSLVLVQIRLALIIALISQSVWRY